MFPTSPIPIVSTSIASPSKIIRLDNLLVDKEIENDLICSICSCLLVNNRQGCKEGHVFCLSCITTWLEKSKTCPCCRSEINSTEILSKNRYIDKGIEKLKIYCPNKFKNYENVGDDTSLELIESNDGCNEIITIGEMKLHVKYCKFKLVNCKIIGCTSKIRLNQLEHHMNQECDFKLVKCKYGCTYLPHYLKKDIASHEEICLCRKIICNNKSCGQSMLFYQFKEHIESICKFQIIECEFKDGGCKSIFERGKKDQHYSSINHTEFSVKIINDQKLLLSKVKSELEKLKEESTSIYRIYGIIQHPKENDRFKYKFDENGYLQIFSKSDKYELYEVENLNSDYDQSKRKSQISYQSMFKKKDWMTFFKVEKGCIGYDTHDIVVKVTTLKE